MPIRETIANWLVGKELQEANTSVSEITRLAAVAESYNLTLADVELALEDVGWIRMGSAGDAQTDLAEGERRTIVQRSRTYSQQDPLVTQALRLWVDYVFAHPWTVQSNDQATQELADSILEAPANRRTIGSLSAMRKQARRLLVDGERFLAVFLGAEEKPATVRGVDCLQIERVVTHPEDAETIIGYERRWRPSEGQTGKVAFYVDWDADADGVEHLVAAAERVKGSTVEDPNDVRMTQLAINTIGNRGLPAFTAGLNWAQAHRRFLEDRVTITRARAAMHAKKKVKGGAAAILAAKNAIGTADPSAWTDTPPIAGSTLIENEGVNLEPIRWPQDSQQAAADAKGLKLLFAAASGIAEPFFGSASDSNLATAKTLLRPMELMFTAYQLLWQEFLVDLVEHVALHRGQEFDRGELDVDSPPIVEKDLAVLGQGLVSLANVYPDVARVPQVLQYVLTVLGLNGVDAIMDELEAGPDPTVGAEAAREMLATMVEAGRAGLRENGSRHAPA